MPPTSTTPRLSSAAGYSLIELVITMAIFTVIMGATMSGLSDVIKGNETVLQMANMNNSIRAGMDLMVRDFLQVGSGLPAGHAVSIPNGAGAVAGADSRPAGDQLRHQRHDPAGGGSQPAAGPTINGVQTDVVTVLMADNAFLDVQLSAISDTSATVAGPGTNLSAGPDRVTAGQLMMVSKGSFNTLVQVTAVDAGSARADLRRRRLAASQPVGGGGGQPDQPQRPGPGRRPHAPPASPGCG